MTLENNTNPWSQKISNKILVNMDPFTAKIYNNYVGSKNKLKNVYKNLQINFQVFTIIMSDK